jgi:hypothetical protein
MGERAISWIVSEMPSFAQVLRLGRDLLIAVTFLFLGLYIFAARWPAAISAIPGAALYFAGIAILMKINMRPFSDIRVKDVLAAHFSRAPQAVLSKAAWTRLAVIVLAAPLALFYPVINLTKTIESMNGYAVLLLSSGIFCCVCSVRALLTKVKRSGK